MKKFVSISLVFFILLNIIGSFTLFYYTKNQVNREMKKLIKSKIPIEKLEVIKLTRNDLNGIYYQRIHDGEFRWHGNMYDIVMEMKSGDFVVFYCINDKKEEAIFATFHKLVDDKSQRNGLTKSLNKLLNNILFVGFLHDRNVFLIKNIASLNKIFLNENYCSIIPEVYTPPPQFILYQV